jgi:hypothetical protein
LPILGHRQRPAYEPADRGFHGSSPRRRLGEISGETPHVITTQQAIDHIAGAYGRYIPSDRRTNNLNPEKVQYLSYRQLQEKHKLVFGSEPEGQVYGFWSGVMAYVLQGEDLPPGTDGRGTVIHELIHAVANPEFGNVFGKALDEAAAEYFTRPLAAKAGFNRDDVPYYTNGSVGLIQAIVDLVGEEVVRKAFFGGDTDKDPTGKKDLRRLVGAVNKAKGSGTFNKIFEMAQRGAFYRAVDLLRSSSPRK